MIKSRIIRLIEFIILLTFVISVFSGCAVVDKIKSLISNTSTSVDQKDVAINSSSTVELTWALEPNADYRDVTALKNFSQDGKEIYEVFRVEQHGKYGLVDIGNNVLSECIYLSIISCTCSEYLIAKIETDSGVQTKYLQISQGTVTELPAPEHIEHDTLVKYYYNSSAQTVEKISIQNGVEIRSSYSSEKPVCVYNETGKCAVYKNGSLVTDFIYESASNFSGGLCAVKKNNKWGYVDSDGNTVIDFMYQSVERYSGSLDHSIPYGVSGGFAAVGKNDRWGFFDINGEEVIPCVFIYACPVVQGRAWVKDGEMWGIVVLDGTASQSAPVVNTRPSLTSTQTTTTKPTVIITNDAGEEISVQTSNTEKTTFSAAQ